MYPNCFGKATCKGPVVRRMQSKSDATSAPFMKSSRNCTEQKRLYIFIQKKKMKKEKASYINSQENFAFFFLWGGGRATYLIFNNKHKYGSIRN